MAGVLKKQRKIRGGHRAHVKKLLAQVEDTLKTLHSKILELVDDENEDESIEHEVAEASEITDEITWAVVRIDSTLKSLQINSPIPSTRSTSSGNIISRKILEERYWRKGMETNN